MNLLIGNVDVGAGEYTPFGAASVLAASSQAHSLTWAGAALVLALWTVALLLCAMTAEVRRDVT